MFLKFSPMPPKARFFTKSLPFELTEDQNKVIDEIAHDLAGEAPMNRLLQGDVGSGKTLVACSAIFMAVHSGYQAAFLIPTEILAGQHAETLKGFLEPFNIRLQFISGSTPKKERRQITEQVQEGNIDVLMGNTRDS